MSAVFWAVKENIRRMEEIINNTGYEPQPKASEFRSWGVSESHVCHFTGDVDPKLAAEIARESIETAIGYREVEHAALWWKAKRIFIPILGASILGSLAIVFICIKGTLT